MDASISTTEKRRLPESSPPDTLEQVVLQLKKLKITEESTTMGALISTIGKQKLPESSSPDAHEQVVLQSKKLKVAEAGPARGKQISLESSPPDATEQALLQPKKLKVTEEESTRGASSSTSQKRKSPESSPPDAHVKEHHKKLKVGDDYQVFLSFRGPDTRGEFTDGLYHYMDGVRIRVFRDEEEIPVGEEIGGTILQAIENSEICVPILSRDFASSKWCLMEVEKMVELKKKVMPIFYKVSADDVKLKTDMYKKAMEEHEAKYGKEQVDKWKNALKKIPEVKAMPYSGSYVTEFYKKFVDNVLSELPPRRRCDSKDYLVGMDSRVESMMELLDIGSHDRKYVVIHGMSGIGKTTLANAIFDELSAKFDNACFLEDVSESSSRDLQERLLQGLDPKSIGKSNLSRYIKERFYKRKVLIVLDDVKEWKQIEKLVGESNWFGAGSRIIVTARNRDVLKTAALHKDKVLCFEMKTMDEEEAEALFCRFAFRKNNPSAGFESLSREIVQDAEGLPLFLIVTGSLLYKEDEEVWRDVISRLKTIPVKEVVERLRISYDALEDDHKKIFLDIACLSSIANDRRKAVNMWEACKLHPHYGLKVLTSMSLIRVENNLIRMHSQLKYLGKKIVREGNEEPSKRSRIWVHKEAINVLMNTEGKEKVEVLAIEDGRGETLSNEHFASCRELRFLQLAGANIVGDFRNLLPKLRWLSWMYCPAILSATNLSMRNLVNLDLSHSFIDESWGGWKLIQDMNHLKDLDLSYCESLTITPKFSKNNSLERLVLSSCSKLREIDGSIGKLGKLKYLYLMDCHSLGRLPNEIGCLVKLETLCVFGSGADLKLPNSIGCLKSLTTLNLVGYSVSDIPESIGRLTKLQHLDLRTIAEVLPESLGDLQSLVRLTLLNTSDTSEYTKLPKSLGRLVKLEHLEVTRGTNFDELLESLGNLQELKNLLLYRGKSKKIPGSIGKLKKLEKLHLDGVLEEVPTEVFGLPSLSELTLGDSSFSTLPSTFSQLKLLTKLDLETNHALQELPDLPLSLRILYVSSRSLRKIANLSSLVNLERLQLFAADDYGWSKEMPADSNCFEEGIEKLIKLEKLHLGMVTAQKILQFDLDSLTKLKRFTLDFLQPHVEDSDARPLVIPSASSSSNQRRLELKFPNLSTLKNLSTVELRNCLVKDGLDSLGIQHMENVMKVIIKNCSAELIELTCRMENLSFLKIDNCGSFKTLHLSTVSDLVSLEISRLDEVVEITCLETIVSLGELGEFGITGSKSLERLNLSKFINISEIYLVGCPKLRTIEGIEGLLLDYLSIERCGSLKTLPDLSELGNLESLSIKKCKELVEITGLGSLVSLSRLSITSCESLERLENLSELKKLSSICLKKCPKLRNLEGIEGLFLSTLIIDRCGSLQNRDGLKKRCTKKSPDLYGLGLLRRSRFFTADAKAGHRLGI